MTSKEALKRLENYLKGLPYAINYKKEHDTINKELERLEEINDVWHKNEPMESVDINGNHLQEVYDFLKTTLKENEKLNKVIEILIDRLGLYLENETFEEIIVYSVMSKKLGMCLLNTNKENYDLLKEVFGK